MRYRRLLLSGGALLVLAVAVAGAWGVGGGADGPVAAPARTSTAVVTRCTLTDDTSAAGKITFGRARPLPLHATGTITALPSSGAVVTRGQSLMRVDDRPIILLYGRIPQYRELGLEDTSSGPSGTASTGESTTGETTSDVAKVSDVDDSTPGKATPADKAPADKGADAKPVPVVGRDVRQLEENLRAMGYTQLTPDETFTSATAAAVRRWQSAIGERPTGVVGLGDVVYARGPVRVKPSSQAILGGPVSDGALTTTGRRQVVSADIPAETPWAKRGAAVTVTDSSDRKITGKVIDVETSGTGEGGGDGSDGGATQGTNVTLTVKLATLPAKPQTAGAVTVTHVNASRKGVLCVPVTALVALADGGFGVQRAVAGSSKTSSGAVYLEVKAGMFADGKVEISGPGVTEGLKVTVPKDE